MGEFLIHKEDFRPPFDLLECEFHQKHELGSFEKEGDRPPPLVGGEAP